MFCGLVLEVCFHFFFLNFVKYVQMLSLGLALN